MTTFAPVGFLAALLWGQNPIVEQPIEIEEWHELTYAPAAVGNPLKGLVPYAGDRKDAFPHSMEFTYVALADLQKGYDRFDWAPLERLLDAIAKRGRQAVFRVYLEYPGKKNMIPPFLVADGLKVHKYVNTNTHPFPPAEVETPDYENPNLRRALNDFIAAFGKKYDGDPRIGFVTAGLLGTWGEWHTYPRGELFASKTVQTEVMDAYEAAFKTTPVLLRYPAGPNTWGKAPNHTRRFGYHDDSFAWATLDTGKKGDEWFYMTALREAGPHALVKWKTQPIGGEIRPEAWGKVFDAKPSDERIQDFCRCVEETHATWLMDTGMFREKPSAERRRRAEDAVRRMGYEFQITATNDVMNDKITPAKNRWSVKVVNRGVAPFYYDWRPEIGLLDEKGHVKATVKVDGTLMGLLPGDPPRLWSAVLEWPRKHDGKFVIGMRVPNPLPNGAPVRFANLEQDQDFPGWLTLARGAVR